MIPFRIRAAPDPFLATFATPILANKLGRRRANKPGTVLNRKSTDDSSGEVAVGWVNKVRSPSTSNTPEPHPGRVTRTISERAQPSDQGTWESVVAANTQSKDTSGNGRLRQSPEDTSTEGPLCPANSRAILSIEALVSMPTTCSPVRTRGARVRVTARLPRNHIEHAFVRTLPERPHILVAHCNFAFGSGTEWSILARVRAPGGGCAPRSRAMGFVFPNWSLTLMLFAVLASAIVLLVLFDATTRGYQIPAVKSERDRARVICRENTDASVIDVFEVAQRRDHFYCQAWEVFAVAGTRALPRGLVSTIKKIALVIADP